MRLPLSLTVCLCNLPTNHASSQPRLQLDCSSLANKKLHLCLVTPHKGLQSDCGLMSHCSFVLQLREVCFYLRRRSTRSGASSK